MYQTHEKMKDKSQYKSLLEWRKACSKDYYSAEKQGLLPKICETFGWKLPHKKPSPEEIIQICIDNEITNYLLYRGFRKENKHLLLHIEPWVYMKRRRSDIFKEIREKLKCEKAYVSPEETFKICVDNKIINFPSYQDFRYEFNNSTENLNLILYSNPWVLMNKKKSEFFKELKDNIKNGNIL